MFRRLLKNKKAQNTAEYAILISLVVAGIIAMQTYAQRALQARVRDASTYLQNQTGAIGNTQQYEPYYLVSDYNVNTEETASQRLGNGLVEHHSESDTTRGQDGFREQTYNTSLNLDTGI